MSFLCFGCCKKRKSSVGSTQSPIEGNNVTNSGQQNNSEASIRSATVACTSCDAVLNSRQKGVCRDCLEPHCTQCLYSSISDAGPPSTNHRSLSYWRSPLICSKCLKLSSGTYTKIELSDDFTARELRRFLLRQNVSLDGCKEKADLIVLVLRLGGDQANGCHGNDALVADDNAAHSEHVEALAARMLEVRLAEQISTTLLELTQQRQQQERQLSVIENDSVEEKSPIPVPECLEETPSGEGVPIANEAKSEQCIESDSLDGRTNESEQRDTELNLGTISETVTSHNIENTGRQIEKDVEEAIDPETMTLDELKDFLKNNEHEYSDEASRDDLIGLVKKFKQPQPHTDTTDPTVPNSKPEAVIKKHVPLCSLCGSQYVDCVLLDCGHMVTCTSCAQGLTECPVCHQFVKRAVHAYRV